MSASLENHARDLVDSLVANGAELHFHQSIDSRPPSFHYELRPGGDRQRCRRIIAEAKADPALWRGLVAEIGRRCEGAQ